MTYRLLPRIPWAFRLFRQLMRWDVPGAWRLYQKLVAERLKAVALPFSLPDGSRMYLPATWPGMISGRGLAGYEPDAIQHFADQTRRTRHRAILIDCGADAGVFTRMVLAQAPQISRIIAFEPNPQPFALLVKNCTGLPPAVTLKRAAVSSTPGRTTLVLDAAQDNDHGAFIGEGGAISVDIETIDQLDLPPDCFVALKIDVEGEELKVLQGAFRTLQRCAGFVVQFEAHPDVMARTGVDPIECLRLLRQYGAHDWTAFCERTRETVADLSPELPFFRQLRQDEIYDVVAVCSRRLESLASN